MGGGPHTRGPALEAMTPRNEILAAPLPLTDLRSVTSKNPNYMLYNSVNLAHPESVKEISAKLSWTGAKRKLKFDHDLVPIFLTW